MQRGLKSEQGGETPWLPHFNHWTELVKEYRTVRAMPANA